MWTYTAYILSMYLTKEPAEELKFAEFANFIEVLWRKEKLVLYDSVEDLLLDIKYLEKLGVLTLNESDNLKRATIKITDKAKLERIAKIVEDSAALTGVELFNAYVQRINSAIANCL